jgi:hypothetical protein
MSTSYDIVSILWKIQKACGLFTKKFRGAVLEERDPYMYACDVIGPGLLPVDLQAWLSAGRAQARLRRSCGARLTSGFSEPLSGQSSGETIGRSCIRHIRILGQRCVYPLDMRMQNCSRVGAGSKRALG